MKKIIFLITLLLVSFIAITDTSAQTNFYEGEYISNIWFNKYNPSDKLIYYNQARFIRKTGTNNIAYCLEPFTDFIPSTSYEEATTPTNLTNNQRRTMSLIAHFGYGYENHTEPKWYAVTQMMIWKVANPNVQYYFTSSAKGEKIYFDTEANEIQNLINNYEKNTFFHGKTFTIVANTSFSHHDFNNVINNYKATNENIKISFNRIITPNLTPGKYTINLERNSAKYQKPTLFYQSAVNQDLIELGDPQTKTNKFYINVVETEVKINKLDKDNKSTIPQGKASIAGTVLSLYDEHNAFIKDIHVDETGTVTLKNLNFGRYYIKEKTPGVGYKLNTNKYYFTLDENNLNIEINITNEIIKGTLKLTKLYGYQDNFSPEPNISFNIHDHNNNLVQTITTDEFGKAEITLPYGKYTLTQLTTTEGYQKIEPIEFEIDQETTTLEKEFKNYRIEVPDTYTLSLLDKIIIFIKELLCIKK